MKFAILFHDNQTGTPMDDIGRVLNLSLDNETLTGFDVDKGHSFEKWAPVLGLQKFEEFSLSGGQTLFLLNHAIEVAIQTRGAFFQERSLGAASAQGACDRPADSSSAAAVIDPVEGGVLGGGADAEFGGLVSTWLSAAHHHLPAVALIVGTVCTKHV
jgi:hypothetical protein